MKHTNILAAGMVVFAGLFAGAVRSEDLGAFTARGVGVEWVVDARGNLLMKEKVVVTVEIDEANQSVVEVIVPKTQSKVGLAERREQALMVEMTKQTGARSYKTVSVHDGLRREVTTVITTDRLWSYEIWSDNRGRLVLYKTRDVALDRATRPASR
jgi:hypothetical protein